ncbi:MAG: hypothetical protein Q9170_000310 [Blastenia crenularia]
MSESNKSRWSEAEKNALLISLLAASGPPNWKDVKLPAGRSKMACQHVYMAAVKEAQGVAVGDNKNADAIKKRSPKKGTSSKSKISAKRKRGGKGEDKADHESEVSEAEERDTKKFKAEVKSDQSGEDQEVKLEAEEI